MKSKILGVLLCASLVATLAVGCSNSNTSTASNSEKKLRLILEQALFQKT